MIEELQELPAGSKTRSVICEIIYAESEDSAETFSREWKTALFNMKNCCGEVAVRTE